MDFVDILKILRENHSSKKMLSSFYRHQFPDISDRALKREIDKIYEEWTLDWCVQSLPKD